MEKEETVPANNKINDIDFIILKYFFLAKVVYRLRIHNVCSIFRWLFLSSHQHTSSMTKCNLEPRFRATIRASCTYSYSKLNIFQYAHMVKKTVAYPLHFLSRHSLFQPKTRRSNLSFDIGKVKKYTNNLKDGFV